MLAVVVVVVIRLADDVEADPGGQRETSAARDGCEPRDTCALTDGGGSPADTALSRLWSNPSTLREAASNPRHGAASAAVVRAGVVPLAAIPGLRLSSPRLVRRNLHAVQPALPAVGDDRDARRFRARREGRRVHSSQSRRSQINFRNRFSVSRDSQMA